MTRKSQDILTTLGLCVECGAPTKIKRHPGRFLVRSAHYPSRCPEHLRIHQNAYNRNYRRMKRQRERSNAH